MTYDDVVQVFSCFPEKFIDELQELYFLLENGQLIRDKMTEIIDMYSIIAKKICETESPKADALKRIAERSLESKAILVEDVFGFLGLIKFKIDYERTHKSLTNDLISNLKDSKSKHDPFENFDKKGIEKFRDRIIYNFLSQNSRIFW